MNYVAILIAPHIGALRSHVLSSRVDLSAYVNLGGQGHAAIFISPHFGESKTTGVLKQY